MFGSGGARLFSCPLTAAEWRGVPCARFQELLLHCNRYLYRYTCAPRLLFAIQVYIRARITWCVWSRFCYIMWDVEEENLCITLRVAGYYYYFFFSLSPVNVLVCCVIFRLRLRACAKKKEYKARGVRRCAPGNRGHVAVADDVPLVMAAAERSRGCHAASRATRNHWNVSRIIYRY